MSKSRCIGHQVITIELSNPYAKFRTLSLNLLWLVDATTYIPTAEGTVYLAVVRDIFSRHRGVDKLVLSRT
ncbi:MAG: hypothetical protein F4077_07500 [Gammaproteobacteria bacterium]|nr:hypothetical protein [Gammaproteobacteria bacterium]MYI77589.1 hypothetical protein [Gammaproteobacteria bacterium]